VHSDGIEIMPRLEFLIHPSGQTQRIELTRLPFVLGRESSAHFAVPSASVSKAHAEIYESDGFYWIRDLGSSNGTFVNNQQIREVPLEQGDIILLAKSEFQFFIDDEQSLAKVSSAETGEIGLPETVPISELNPRSNDGGDKASQAPDRPQPEQKPQPPVADLPVPTSVLHYRPLIQEMLKSQSIRVIYQPIVDLHTRKTVGFEALGRGRSRALSTRPGELFRLAKLCKLAGDLSRAFRSEAVNQAHSLPDGAYIFCNLHPEEVTRLLPANMDQLLPVLPKDRKLILEIPEDGAEDVPLLRELSEQLRKRGVGIAFDDVGKGGSALLSALADARPDFLKLHISLVRDIHRNPGRREVVRGICNTAQNLNVTVVAECLERPEELETCKDLGCQLGQGYLLGHPEYVAPT
jgi:EAL domain-containing protein (putative c-di-GMP-specific phosphodiesterase class I)